MRSAARLDIYDSGYSDKQVHLFNWLRIYVTAQRISQLTNQAASVSRREQAKFNLLVLCAWQSLTETAR